MSNKIDAAYTKALVLDTSGQVYDVAAIESAAMRKYEYENHIKTFVSLWYSFDESTYENNVTLALNLIGNRGKELYNEYNDINMLNSLIQKNIRYGVIIKDIHINMQTVPISGDILFTQTGYRARGSVARDISVIVLFSTFTNMAQGGSAHVADFINIPVSILLGIALGAVAGYGLSLFFETAYAKEHYVRNSMKVILILGMSFFLMSVETWLKGKVSVSGLLAVVSMAAVIRIKCIPKVSKRLSEKFGKLWIAAEVILFVLVGAAVDIRYTMQAGIAAVLMIFVGLMFRAVGVSLCMLGTKLNKKERLFCVIAYLPKATVQAAIGSVPLAMGLPCGQIVLSVAVLAILITAPLGAAGMDLTYDKLLVRSED